MSDHDDHVAATPARQAAGYVSAVLVALLFAFLIAQLNSVSLFNSAAIVVVILFALWAAWAISLGARAETDVSA
jgi:hypothetical protein